mgnify:CR=1 FL=1
MFFLASKALWFLMQPSIACVLLIAAGLGLKWRWAAAVRLAWAGVVVLALLLVSPLGNLLIYPLEARFAATPQPDPQGRYAGILILGGFEETFPSTFRRGLGLGEAAERLTEALRLAHRMPAVRVVFTGGALDGVGQLGVEGVRQYMRDAGIDPERTVIEARSRTTFENARFSAELLHPQPGDTYILVTSAFHMPRSIATFRAAGFDVLPYPVDFRTGGPETLWIPYSNPVDNLQTAEVAVKEWVGLIAYRLTGRTRELWPGP